MQVFVPITDEQLERGLVAGLIPYDLRRPCWRAATDGRLFEIEDEPRVLLQPEAGERSSVEFQHVLGRSGAAIRRTA